MSPSTGADLGLPSAGDSGEDPGVRGHGAGGHGQCPDHPPDSPQSAPVVVLTQSHCPNWWLTRAMLQVPMQGHGGESPDLANYDTAAPVLHVLVVGFHHKKGCQVSRLHIM